MNRFAQLLVVALALVFASAAPAQAQKKAHSEYDYVQGVVEFDNGNSDEALRHFERYIVDHPKDGFALSYLGRIVASQGEDKKAIQYFDQALANLPKKARREAAEARTSRGVSYLVLGDTVAALADFDVAALLNPEYVSSLFQRGKVALERGNLDAAMADFERSLQIDESYVYGLYGKGRVYNKRGEYEKAVECFTRVLKLDEEDVFVLPHRAEAYMGMSKMHEATNDLVAGFDNGRSFADNMEVAKKLEGEGYEMLVTKLDRNVTNSFFGYSNYMTIATLAEVVKDYERAKAYYRKGYEAGSSSFPLAMLSNLYLGEGDYKSALQTAQEGKADYGSGDMCNVMLSVIYSDLGRYDEAFAEADEYVKANPEYGEAYFRRGDIYSKMGKTDEAIADYSKALELGALFSLEGICRLRRGELYSLKGETELATADYEQVLDIDKELSGQSVAPFALLALGRESEAQALSDSIITRFADDEETFYHAACLQCRMGHHDTSMELLRKGYDHNFRRAGRIRHATDLAPLRERADFQQLLADYDALLSASDSEQLVPDSIIATPIESVTAEVPVTKDGSAYKVSCMMNDFPLTFEYDEAAEGATMAEVDALFLHKNGYVTDSELLDGFDFVQGECRIADGTTMTLRKVEFGDFTIDNLRVTVKRGQKASLILDSAAMKRVGKGTLDKTKRVLSVTYTPKR